ncbi:Hypothetical protein POVN_LOCUS348 [uncultured virus]|nr:Hypothetical protein POVN_LOCUS348 [uncultured virus]
MQWDRSDLNLISLLEDIYTGSKRNIEKHDVVGLNSMAEWIEDNGETLMRKLAAELRKLAQESKPKILQVPYQARLKRSDRWIKDIVGMERNDPTSHIEDIMIDGYHGTRYKDEGELVPPVVYFELADGKKAPLPERDTAFVPAWTALGNPKLYVEGTLSISVTVVKDGVAGERKSHYIGTHEMVGQFKEKYATEYGPGRFYEAKLDGSQGDELKLADTASTIPLYDIYISNGLLYVLDTPVPAPLTVLSDLAKRLNTAWTTQDPQEARLLLDWLEQKGLESLHASLAAMLREVAGTYFLEVEVINVAGDHPVRVKVPFTKTDTIKDVFARRDAVTGALYSTPDISQLKMGMESRQNFFDVWDKAGRPVLKVEMYSYSIDVVTLRGGALTDKDTFKAAAKKEEVSAQATVASFRSEHGGLYTRLYLVLDTMETVPLNRPEDDPRSIYDLYYGSKVPVLGLLIRP